MKKMFFDEDGDVKIGSVIKAAVIAVVLFIALCVFWPFKVIGPTERGVIKTFGDVRETILEPGLKVKIPIVQKVTTYDLTPIIIKVDVPMGEDGAVSKDKQTIGVNGSVIWKYDETRIVQLAKSYGSESALASQIRVTVINIIKQTIGRYDIDAIVQDQSAIAQAARSRMIQEFTNWPITIDVVNLDNWDWSEDYDQMIKQTVAMQQATQRAAAELLMIEQQAQQQIKKATAEAEAKAAEADGRRRAAELDAAATIAKAKGDAESRRIEGEGIAAYNRSIASTLDTQRALRQLDIAMKEAERWDGRRVPTYVPLNPTGGIVTLPGNASATR